MLLGQLCAEVGHCADRGEKSLFPGCVARCHGDRMAQVQLGGRVFALHIQIPGASCAGKTLVWGCVGLCRSSRGSPFQVWRARNYNTSNAVTEVTWTGNYLLRTDFTSLGWHLQPRRPWGGMDGHTVTLEACPWGVTVG